jgi:hypothetical protein
MLIIVDEAGDAGLKLSKGSSKFLIQTTYRPQWEMISRGGCQCVK